MLNNIWKIIKNDAKNSLKNPVIIIVIIAIIILPSLYAVLNVQACWDPYGKTGNMDFAVVNLDDGSTYNGISQNFGNDLVNELKDNNQFNWQFTNETDARDGVTSGKYYAAIIVPDNFTESVLSITSQNPQPSSLEYLVNEKISPVGSRMTDSGAKEIQTNLNNMISQTVGNQALTQVATVGASLPVQTSLSKLSAVNESGANNYFYSPVSIDRKAVYPVDNYGSSVAPFYISLALWLGAIMSGVILKTRYNDPIYKPVEMYFGRMVLYIVIGLLQAIVTASGCLLVGMEVANPLLFVLTVLFGSIVCTTIVYSLISLFDNGGKALAIIILVLQISGTGGMYPIQIMASFFGMAHNYLPMTYCIDAIREVMLGMYWPNFTAAMLKLIVYPLITFIVSVLIKFKFDGTVKGFVDKLHDSGLA
ncbi:MAG: YhgE/Pip domain-containing protein [Methanobacteriaceae archaeon]|jgi:putative membrane protein|uniref:YhgE/Pip domain-containing protein n=1 Tax=Methanobrevibacter TaxID=2172 RepID=UPI0037621846|nr:YhgE/Pip domain-containing protein [Methanobacteriaceae archaeon]